MIDTHTHLYLEEFECDSDGAVQRALDAGVEHLIFPNVNLQSIEPMKTLAARWPNAVSMGMGLHPEDVKESWHDDTLAALDELGDGSGYVAVGEIGIDMYWDKTYEREQMLAFEMQVSRAKELGLPVIIHCREGLDQVLEVMREFPGVQAVMHSFGGTPQDVERIRNFGDYYFGINGIVTFKNCRVRDTLPEITLDRIVLETDSPYLAPVPHRGKRNESAYLPHVAAHIAAHLGVPVQEVDARTTDNAKRLFFEGLERKPLACER